MTCVNMRFDLWMHLRLEGWNSTIELHPRIENLSHRERDCVQIEGFLPSTCTKNTPIMTKEIHSLPFDWARIGHGVL